MMHSIRLQTLLFGVLVMGGCAAEAVTYPTAASIPNGTTPVVMSASSYVLDGTGNSWSGEIAFSFTNLGDRTISLLNCQGGYGLRLEKLEGGEWVTAWAPVLLMCLSRPIEIPPGATRQDRIAVFAGATGSNSYPQFMVEPIAGTYRLVIGGAFWDYDHDGPPWGVTPPLEFRVSNSFEIRTGG